MSQSDRALNRLAKWRTVFAGWQLGTRAKGDPECDAVRDQRELLLLLRAEVNTLTALCLAKGLFTVTEWDANLATEADLLSKSLSQRFPGFRATDVGLEMDSKLAAETNQGMAPVSRSIRDIALLLALADGTEHSGRALGALLELPPSTVYRRLHALEEEGLVRSRAEETIEAVIGIARLRYTLTDAGARVIGLPVLNELEYHVLAHSTAWESRSPLCRNHFCASEGHHDWPTLQALCERGMMQERKPVPPAEGSSTFIVTQLGIRALEKRGTAGKQSQRRSTAW